MSLEKCARCRNMLENLAGDRITAGWAQPDGLDRDSPDKLLTPFACEHCDTRWMRTETRIPRAVRWEQRSGGGSKSAEALAD